MLVSRAIRNENKVINTSLLPSNNNSPTPVSSLEGALTVGDVPKQRKRNLQECVSGPPNLSSRLGSTETPNHSPMLGSVETTTTFILEDGPQRQKRGKFRNTTVIDIDSDSETPTASGATVSSNPSPTPRSKFIEKVVHHPLSDHNEDQSDFVLETTIAGSSEIRLIHCSKNHPLDLFVRGVRTKYGLRPDQEIVGIRVKSGQKTFKLDLGEARDWMYVSTVIMKNGAKGEMVISIK